MKSDNILLSETTGTKNNEGLNLLNIGTIRNLVNWRGFPYTFQFVVLVIFIGLIFLGWQVYTPEGINDKLFAKSNIVTLLVWGIWWPLMVWIAVTMGRVWCTVCPLELVSSFTEKAARKLGIRQKALSKWIRNGTIILVLYAIIQLLIPGIKLHRVPAYTSFFLIGLLTLSAFVGFFFRDRAFCRGFCPIGMLLNAYGRGGMIAVRAGSDIKCSECTGKECAAAECRYKIDQRNCPGLLNPSRLNTNADCLVCGQCLKSCKQDNMQLLLRKPFSQNDVREEKAGWALTIFIMLVSGFVTSELTIEWKAANKIFTFIPGFVTEILGTGKFGGFIEGIWTVIIFPILLWTIFGVVTLISKGAETITDAWRRLALPLGIIIFAGHLIKAVAKFNTWINFLPGSINDPVGQERVQKVAAGINVPAALFSNQIVSVIGVILLIIAFIYSVREEKIISANPLKRLIPKILLFVL